MNAMLYVRGRPLDYDLWREKGAAGWGWEDVRPYFLRAEDNQRGASEHPAVGGPLRVEDERLARPPTHRFLAAAERTGIPRVSDYNGPEQDGASMVQVTQRNGRRWGAADAYLRPAMSRKNLKVITGTQALSIKLSGDRATGVRIRDRKQIVAAGREVLLSAGAIGSPQLLMLSGIGPAEHLRERQTPRTSWRWSRGSSSLARSPPASRWRRWRASGCSRDPRCTTMPRSRPTCASARSSSTTGRHVPDGLRRRRRRGSPSCACAASSAYASSTHPSCP